MKIVRYKRDQKTGYGKLENGTITKIAGNIFGEFYLTETKFELAQTEIVNPIDPPNVIAIGKNYEQHVKEGGEEQLPERPVIFLKATTTVIGPGDEIVLPEMAPTEVDYEAELAVVIGKKAKDVAVEDVDDYILGYTCANDVSARDCQLRYDQQWARGKSFDTFCPLGPWIETSLNPNSCEIRSKLNGSIMQDSITSDMIFKVEELVSYCSKNMTLLPGTVILTGTPEGVGFARDPQVFLSAGDEIDIEIEGIGVLHNQVINNSKNKSGSRVAQAWAKYFGTTQLTPHLFDKIKSFIDDGLSEDVIVEVIKLAVEKAQGNPSNYVISILNDCLHRDIYSLDDFKEDQDKGGESNGQVQKNDRKKDGGTSTEDLEELYKKGYR